jgi:hypothetical protein
MESAGVFCALGCRRVLGIGGSIGLLMRKQCSRWLLDISLAAVFIQMSYTMVIAGGLQVMGPQGAFMPLIIVGIAAGLVRFVRYARRQEWLYA